MIRCRLRPGYVIPLETSRKEAMTVLQNHCRSMDRGSWFRMTGEYGEMHLDPSQRRLWSPHLSFYVSSAEPTPTHMVTAQDSESPDALLRVRFAPRFEVWTCVWAIYLAMAFSAFFGAALGYSQWMVGEHPWGLYVSAVGVVIIAILHVVACTGQHWSADQMDELRDRLQEVLTECELLLRASANEVPPSSLAAN